MRLFLLAAASLVLAQSAFAANLAPMEPRFVDVGERNAVVYYTDTAEGFEVVVTIAANSPDDGTSIRSVVTLAPGQQTRLSLGGSVGQTPATIIIRRDADSLTIDATPVRTAWISPE